MSDKENEIELLPCPFCGESGPEISEGSTHRWMEISCCGEVRKADIMLPANHPVNMKLAAEVWNTRAARSEASAWVPIRSAEDLPPQDGTEWWCTFGGYNGKPEVHKGRVDCAGTRWLLSLTLSVPWDRVTAIMPIAKPPSPYTADSGKGVERDL